MDQTPADMNFGDRVTYFDARVGHDALIILDPNIDEWRISGDQLEFLRIALKRQAQARNIFAFFHQVLWWEPDNQFGSITLNSLEGRSDSMNFCPAGFAPSRFQLARSS